MDLSKQDTTFKEYDRKMKQYSKEEILDELLVFIESGAELGGEEFNNQSTSQEKKQF